MPCDKLFYLMKVRIPLLALTVATAGIAAAQAPRPMQVLAAIGDVLAPFSTPIASLNAPFLSGPSSVTFSGTVSGPTEYFIVQGNTVIFRGTDMAGATGGESTMGATVNSQFVYSPSLGGDDALVANGFLSGQGTNAPAVLLKEPDPAPGTVGNTITFASRPTMAFDGSAFWVSGFATAGTTTAGRILYRKRPGQAFEIIAKSFEVFNGVLPDNTPIAVVPGDIGIEFGYDFSDNANNGIFVLGTAATSTATAFSNDHLFVNNRLIAKEGESAGAGFGNFGSASATGAFGSPVVNNSGAYAAIIRTTIGGWTVYANGSFQLKVGDTLNGVALTQASARPMAINNSGWVGHVWGTTTATASIFLGGGSVLNGSRTVVRAGDRVDTNADGAADASINTIEGGSSIGPAMAVDEQGNIYVRVQFTPDGGAQKQAMVKFPYRPGDVDFSLEVDAADIDLVIAAFGATPGAPGWDPLADIDLSGEIDAADIDITIANFGS